MAPEDARTHGRPVVIAPAPAVSSSAELGAHADAPPVFMPYTCQSCAKRKVKCDKITPTCSTCQKGKLECVYQAPPPRWRKRKLSGDVNEKLARYERILHQHGLLPQDTSASPSVGERPREKIYPRSEEPETPRPGKILADRGKSRYIDSYFWRYLGDEELQDVCDDEDEYESVPDIEGNSALDPLTGAFLGSRQSLLHYHPTHEKGMLLWKIYVDNVEPISRFLHVPTTSMLIETASKHPEMASKSDECLLFGIYHFAVFTMSDAKCAEELGQSRATLMPRYHFAARQALVNASFLKTTELSILQALVLFLLPCRFFYDLHTYWILTGVAVRIGQRMGLHRDGEKLGLPPFEVEMRRRIFYQLVPLDGAASHMTGTDMGLVPSSWDTCLPSNINDDQIWPGMTEMPRGQKGATEMIFFLARSCLGRYFVKAEKSMQGLGFWELSDFSEAERVIDAAESEVEENYIRYCDIVNPLHFLTVAMARSAITGMRIRVRLPKVKNQTATDAERRELFQLAQKIIDTDTAVYDHASIGNFLWHVRPFFLWGSWDSMIFILTTLWRSDLLSPAEVDATWAKVKRVYSHHGEFLEPKRALSIALGRLTLKAWEANPPRSKEPEPAFITALRSLRKASRESQAGVQDSNATPAVAKTDTVSAGSPPSTHNADALISNLSSDLLFNGIGLDIGDEFLLDPADWMLWDKLIKDYQAQGGSQDGGYSK